MPTLALDNGQLYYTEGGSGRPVLLIHGTQPDANVWGPTFTTLAQHTRVIAYDRRGFSRSTAAASSDYRTHAADAAALLEHLGALPATVLGWSWGGVVALELAAARPDLVANLVLVEPALHLKKHPTLGVVGAVMRTELMCRWRGEVAGAETFLDWACRRTTGGSAFQAFPESLRAVVRHDARAIMGEVRAGTGEGLTEARIAAIDRPGTLMLGEWSDAAFGKAAHRVGRLLPCWRMVRVPRAGHAVHFDQPKAFVQAVLQCAAAGPGAE